MFRLRGALLLTFVVCAAALLAACDWFAPGPLPAPTPTVRPGPPTRTPTPTPRPAVDADLNILEDAFRTLFELKSFEAVVAAEPGTAWSIETDYVYVAPHSLYMHTHNRSFRTSYETLASDGRFYRRERGRWVDRSEYEIPEVLRPSGGNRLLQDIGVRAGADPDNILAPFSSITYLGEGRIANGSGARRYHLVQEPIDKYEYRREITVWVDPQTKYIHRLSVDVWAWSVPAQRPEVRGSPTPTAEPDDFYTYSVQAVLRRHNDPGVTPPDPQEVLPPNPTRTPGPPATPTPVLVARSATSRDLDLIARAYDTMQGLRSYQAQFDSVTLVFPLGTLAQYEVTWVAPDRAHLKGWVLGRDVELLAEGGTGYVRVDGEWMEEIPDGTKELLTDVQWARQEHPLFDTSLDAFLGDPGSLLRDDFQAMLNAGARVEILREAGSEDAGPLRRFRISYGRNRYVGALPTSTPGAVATPLAVPEGERYYRLDLLVDSETGYIHRAVRLDSNRDPDRGPPVLRRTATPESGPAPLSGYIAVTYSRHNDSSLQVPAP